MTKENIPLKPEITLDPRVSQLLSYLDERINKWRKDEKSITSKEIYLQEIGEDDATYQIREKFYELFPELKPKETPRAQESPLVKISSSLN